jgi:hypothetical protein
MVVFDRLWSGRAVAEHKYVFLFFCCFLCVCLHVSLYVSNHFNHCIKLFVPCGTLIGNNKFLFLFYTCTFILIKKILFIFYFPLPIFNLKVLQMLLQEVVTLLSMYQAIFFCFYIFACSLLLIMMYPYFIFETML